MFPLIPCWIVNSVCELTPAALSARGIDTLLLDFDNTLQAYSQASMPEMNADWIATMKSAGIELCVVSNSKKSRAVPFCEEFGIPIIRNAKKPFSRGIRQAMQLYVNRTGIALIGDQIYTDVLGANLCGIQSILVKPIHLSNVWLKLRHYAELPWIAIGKHNEKKS